MSTTTVALTLLPLLLLLPLPLPLPLPLRSLHGAFDSTSSWYAYEQPSLEHPNANSLEALLVMVGKPVALVSDAALPLPLLLLVEFDGATLPPTAMVVGHCVTGVVVSTITALVTLSAPALRA